MRLARIMSDSGNAGSRGIGAQTGEHIRSAAQPNWTETGRWTNPSEQVSYEAGQSSEARGEPDEAEGTSTASGSSDSGSDDNGGFPGKMSAEQFPNIHLVEDFLTRSAAFHALSHNLGIFVLPRSLSQLALSIPPSQIRFSNDNDVSLVNKIKTFIEEHTGAQWNWWPLSPRKQLLGPNQTRMHWQCVCGLFSRVFARLTGSSSVKSIFGQRYPRHKATLSGNSLKMAQLSLLVYRYAARFKESKGF